MKSKFTKIVIMSLVALLLFGTFSASAYESYDTYTYSIDGEPLASPHAYTPDVTTYNSKVMGILDGDYWHFDSTGDIVAWPQIETNSGFELADLLSYTVRADGTAYTSGYAVEELNKAVNVLVQIKEAYNAVYGNSSASQSATITVLPEEIIDADGTYFEVDELVDAVKNVIASKITGDLADKKVSVETADIASYLNSYRTMLFDQMGLLSVNVQVLDVYDEHPVVGLGAGTFKIPDFKDLGYDDDTAALAKEVYKDALNRVVGIYLPEGISVIEENVFVDAKIVSSIYYNGESSDEWKTVDAKTKGNDALKKAKLYCYSESQRFGNLALNAPSDVVSDEDGNIYIADKNNNRIVVLEADGLKVKGIISNYIDENNKDRALNSPEGVYVTNSKLMVDGSGRQIYVCNTGNKNIVVFDENYNYVKTIEQPPIAGMLDEGEFEPSAIAVDKYGRIFVVSKTCYKGIIVMSNQGVFTGFIGAQKVTTDFMDQIWKNFQTIEQKQSSVMKLPDPFNNLTVDENGFVYATITFSKGEDLKQQIATLKTKLPAYSPVKKLNSMGVEIMKRNGFFDPGGEVINSLSVVEQKPSTIIDVAIGDEGSWTILDSSRQRTFTYDKNGNLLFAFGNKGDQLGNNAACIGLTYQPVLNENETGYVDYKYNMVILDKSETGYYLTVYHPTEYCDMIMQALHNENDHKFGDTIKYWQNVLTRNNNFDLAYIGIGKALYHLGEYDEAMKMLQSAYETEYYALAFAEVRKDFISKFMIPLIVGIIGLILLLFKFLGYAKKRNKAVTLKVGKKTFTEELLYVFHLIFHPFDGFWDLKHEKRGSVRAGTTILAITIVAFFYQAIGTGYMHNPRGDYSTVFIQIIAVVVPVVLWIVGNWCLTTLFDGEGSFKDIYIATCYSLAPLPFFVTISTILSNVLTVTEGSILSLLVTFGYLWVGILLFFGMVVTHDYTTGKNFIATIGTIVAMAVIMFIILLFSSLVIKMVTFIVALFTEIFNRIVT